MVAVLKEVTAKESVALDVSQIPTDVAPPRIDHAWTQEELADVHLRTLGFTSGSIIDGPRVILHVLYVDGRDAKSDRDGVAFTDFAVVYIDQIRGHVPGTDAHLPATLAAIERSVLTHEVGHVLGLVDHGIPMRRPHEDPQSSYHSSNPSSVMSSRIDITPSSLATATPLPDAFDADDLADLAAARAQETRAHAT